MNLSPFSVFLCSMMFIGVVYGAILNMRDREDNTVGQTHLRYNIMGNSQVTQEDIYINYELNYVRVETPAVDNIEAMVMIHDYTRDMTLFKIRGGCYLMNEYADIPPKIEDWHNIEREEGVNGGMVDAGGIENQKSHTYKLLPFSLNRTSLPMVMQLECPEIEVIVFEETLEGEPAARLVNANVTDSVRMMGEVYLPKTCDPEKQSPVSAENREKRAAGCNCLCCLCQGCRRCIIIIIRLPPQQ